ncbi:GntR family transcriptional regulator, transcriptional repressor for pyruvate dehydrogenase complex [Tardiphaga sp. OK246]|jgi:GntR family transcriptional repressor for pyruvate dehydrogenase complex|uniref:FadR/GntR family transcriptional regulator n=1 Tax=Tardiphaga sp. OK246 TaxID=1855307 RepID=UPI000B63823E|nr:FadR/GntR family transcriptional regulator [Tardiphaga sp. OK246]SNT09055.1 GntR family transcriptional regulator, transcriptional repressor for pyruvate dehydrogenase complex [Tardiphaga sp. OK246]
MKPIDPSELPEAPRPRGAAGSLVDKVYGELAQRIANGDYAPDQKLPGEHELADMFDVSRPVLREALGRLREDGLITSRQGAGSFVQMRAQQQPLGFARVETIADIQRCFEFRITMEADAAHFAALRRSDDNLGKMEAALGLLREATKKRKHREDADYAFHLAVSEATNNHYFATSLNALKDHVAVGMKLHGLSLMGPRPGLEQVFEEHSSIFEAIRDRDAEAARTAMRLHLETSRDRLFEGRLLDLSFR